MIWPPRQTEAVWGEGFAEDSWAEIMAPTEWAAVHPDEFIRFFPGLGQPKPEGLARPLRDHLRETVRSSQSQQPVPLMQHAGTMPLPQVARLLGRVMSGRARPGSGPTKNDSVALDTLAPLVDALTRGATPAFDEILALALAFGGGVHPAYLWPAALPMVEIATAAGWLGLVYRGRPAYLPADIAATLRDTVGHRTDGYRGVRDRRLGFCGFTAEQWAEIGAAARRRLAGRREVVRLGTTARWRPAFLRPAGLSHMVANATSP